MGRREMSASIGWCRRIAEVGFVLLVMVWGGAAVILFFSLADAVRGDVDQRVKWLCAGLIAGGALGVYEVRKDRRERMAGAGARWER